MKGTLLKATPQVNMLGLAYRPDMLTTLDCMAKQSKTEQLHRWLDEQIRTGALRPRDLMPSRAELEASGWGRSAVHTAFERLEGRGLIDRGVAGGRITVRSPRARHVRDAVTRYRAGAANGQSSLGAAELTTGKAIRSFTVPAVIDIVEASADLATEFRIPPGDPLIRRVYTWVSTHDEPTFQLTTSWLPHEVGERNPKILDPDNEPWPGGTYDQLASAGLAPTTSTDRVTARMPFLVEADQLQTPPGVPVLCIRKVSTDPNGRVVEVTDSVHPADTTELVYRINLEGPTE